MMKISIYLQKTRCSICFHPHVYKLCITDGLTSQKTGFQRRLLRTSRIANAPLNRAPGRIITVIYRYEMEAWKAVLVYYD